MSCFVLSFSCIKYECFKMLLPLVVCSSLLCICRIIIIHYLLSFLFFVVCKYKMQQRVENCVYFVSFFLWFLVQYRKHKCFVFVINILMCNIYFLIQADGTYETQSRLIFTATRFDNGITLACQASNLVMENMGEIPYRSPVKLQVNCKSIIFPKFDAVLNLESRIHQKWVHSHLSFFHFSSRPILFPLSSKEKHFFPPVTTNKKQTNKQTHSLQNPLYTIHIFFPM